MVVGSVPSNTTSIVNLFAWVNVHSGYWFGRFMLIGMFLVLFFQLKRYSTAKAFAAASFLTAIFSVVLLPTALVGQREVTFAGVVVCLAIVALYVEGQNS